jgi:hypothetical protein
MFVRLPLQRADMPMPQREIAITALWNLRETLRCAAKVSVLLPNGRKHLR